jgi:hypothetical protein
MLCEPTFRMNITPMHSLHAGFLLGWVLPRRWKWYIPLKRWFRYGFHGPTSQELHYKISHSLFASSCFKLVTLHYHVIRSINMSVTLSVSDVGCKPFHETTGVYSVQIRCLHEENPCTQRPRNLQIFQNATDTRTKGQTLETTFARVLKVHAHCASLQLKRRMSKFRVRVRRHKEGDGVGCREVLCSEIIVRHNWLILPEIKRKLRI